MVFNYRLQIYNIYFIRQIKINNFQTPLHFCYFFYLISLINESFCLITLSVKKSLLLYKPNKRQTYKNCTLSNKSAQLELQLSLGF